MINILKEIYYFFYINVLHNIIIIASALALILGFANHKRLPTPPEILPALSQEPTQTIKPAKLLEIVYKGVPYQVKEIADYEISGLVVTHNNIDSLFDTYHDETSIDTKDLCLLWGSNLKNTNYLAAKFKSGPWTCYFKPAKNKLISPYKLSNNHLITKDENIRHLISTVDVGDQVHIVGKLVSYKAPNWTAWRQTSVSRTDSGGHACEVILVEKLEILKKTNPLWQMFYFWGAWIFSISLLLRVFFYFLF